MNIFKGVIDTNYEGDRDRDSITIIIGVTNITNEPEYTNYLIVTPLINLESSIEKALKTIWPVLHLSVYRFKCYAVVLFETSTGDKPN